MLHYTVTEAKAKFSEVVEKAMAGEDIIVTKMGKPVIRIDKFDNTPKRPSIVGLCEGQMRVPDDFDEWPEDIARALGMID